MKPESRLDIAERNLAQAAAAVTRQKQIIGELEAGSHSTKGSRILLGLLEDALRNATDALAMIKSGQNSSNPRPSED